jgi:hypothetical protein
MFTLYLMLHHQSQTYQLKVSRPFSSQTRKCCLCPHFHTLQLWACLSSLLVGITGHQRLDKFDSQFWRLGVKVREALSSEGGPCGQPKGRWLHEERQRGLHIHNGRSVPMRKALIHPPSRPHLPTSEEFRFQPMNLGGHLKPQLGLGDTEKTRDWVLW